MPEQDDSWPSFNDDWSGKLVEIFSGSDLTMEQLQQARAKHVAERAYRTSPIKRRRRTRQEMDALRAAIYETVEQVERRLRQYAPGVDLHFDRIAVDPGQIYDLDLPTRPTKRSDSRAKNFDSESVEVDAIPPAMLRALVNKVITRHVHRDTLDVVLAAEESERDILSKMAANYDRGVM